MLAGILLFVFAGLLGPLYPFVVAVPVFIAVLAVGVPYGMAARKPYPQPVLHR